MADQRAGGISWTEETWNPIRGCSMVGTECRNCYAMWVAAVRMSKPGQAYHGIAELTDRGLATWTGVVRTVPDKLDDPLRWKRPRLIFVNSMSDLFHEDLTDEQIDAVVGMMALADWHTYQCLTKRAQRMAEYLVGLRTRPSIVWAVLNRKALGQPEYPLDTPVLPVPEVVGNRLWPLPHVWFGVSVGTQAAFDERMPWVIASRRDAKVLWLSMEPLLERIDVTPPEHRGTNVNLEDWLQTLDWLVVGGESDSRGGEARVMGLGWVRELRDRAINRTDMGRPWPLPFHFKQWGAWSPSGTTGPVITGASRIDLADLPAVHYHKIGKEAAGRILDGRTWDEWPGGFEGPAAAAGKDR